jgi:outer membrane protein assembly factor BamB
MKTYERIRTISTSHSGDKFAVAEFEKRVQIWDLDSGLLRVIETDFDFGGRRLSISSSGKYLTVGSYNKNTVTTYSVDTGEILWTRKDLKKCARVQHSDFDTELVFVTLERQATHIVSADTGETINKISGAQALWRLGNETQVVIEKHDRINLVDKDFKTVKTSPKKTFAILDSTYSADKIFISYSGGPLEAVDLKSFEPTWASKPVGHFLDIGVNSLDKKVIGIRWEYEKGSNKFLSVLNYATGKIENEFDLGDIVEHSFLKQGKYLLTSTGRLISTVDGKTIKEFDFENS